MSSLPQVAEAIHSVLTEVPEAVARATGYCQRRSTFTAAHFVQTLVFGWWQHPAATLSQLSQTAALGNVTITPQGLDQRLGAAGAALLAERLATAVGQVLTADPVAQTLLGRFSAVSLLDSSVIALPDALATIWPGCGGRVPQGTQAALTCTVRFDVRCGGLEGPDLSAGRAQDRGAALQHAPVPAGALRIADQGYGSLDVLAAIAAGDASFLSRYRRGTSVQIGETRLDLPAWLAAQTDDALDVPVTLGVETRVPARLLATRVPQEVADQRRRKLRADARNAGKTAAPQALALADWTVLVTNAPAAVLSGTEARVLGRLRWQIELLFTLWKHHGHLATSRSAKPTHILCEVYAKLLVMVLQHWVLLVGCWAIVDRSLVRAAATIRDAVVLIALTVADPDALVPVLEGIQRWLAAGCRTAKRRKRPSAAQLLADPERAYA